MPSTISTSVASESKLGGVNVLIKISDSFKQPQNAKVLIFSNFSDKIVNFCKLLLSKNACLPIVIKFFPF